MSDDDHAVLAIGRGSRVATLSDIGGNQALIEGIGVWVVNIVVNTCLIVEAGWLPELLHVGA